MDNPALIVGQLKKVAWVREPTTQTLIPGASSSTSTAHGRLTITCAKATPTAVAGTSKSLRIRGNTNLLATRGGHRHSPSFEMPTNLEWIFYLRGVFEGSNWYFIILHHLSHFHFLYFFSSIKYRLKQSSTIILSWVIFHLNGYWSIVHSDSYSQRVKSTWPSPVIQNPNYTKPKHEWHQSHQAVELSTTYHLATAWLRESIFDKLFDANTCSSVSCHQIAIYMVKIVGLRI